ncbi:MAG: hypothetical protein KatS3mg104_0206 [Phycisphaerae bacterium]|jgi:hypothetical protein|nr:MAG: hypothetical protein KatS3mg104_0206 [Phycisphaerae bacterium]
MDDSGGEIILVSRGGERSIIRTILPRDRPEGDFELKCADRPQNTTPSWDGVVEGLTMDIDTDQALIAVILTSVKYCRCPIFL